MKKDFITVSPDNGNSDGTVTVQASGNNGDTRSTTITISGGGIPRTITINQEGKPICIVSFDRRVGNPVSWEWIVSDKPVASKIVLSRKIVDNSTGAIKSTETFTIENGGTKSAEIIRNFLYPGVHYEYSLNIQEDSTFRYVFHTPL